MSSRRPLNEKVCETPVDNHAQLTETNSNDERQIAYWSAWLEKNRNDYFKLQSNHVYFFMPPCVYASQFQPVHPFTGPGGDYDVLGNRKKIKLCQTFFEYLYEASYLDKNYTIWQSKQS